MYASSQNLNESPSWLDQSEDWAIIMFYTFQCEKVYSLAYTTMRLNISVNIVLCVKCQTYFRLQS